MALRKLSPGGYEYLTGAVACADRELEPGESLADYYFAHGYPPGEWHGNGARVLGVSGQVTHAQMTALFGEGRHPNADRIEADLIAAGASVDEALDATKLGRQFQRYGRPDELRSDVIAAYTRYRREHDLPVGAPIDEPTRARIRNRVQRDAFAADHDGRIPRDHSELTAWLAEQRRDLKTSVAGYEMIFAPPKSVSVAWALADGPTRERIATIHRQAVTDALTHFERHAAFTRQGNHGEAQVDVNGITAVLFEHWDSRAGDPHLHTHVPISTKVQRADGKWTALDGRTVFAATVTISEFYASRLRDLFRDHGATWTRRPSDGVDLKRPVWELDGIPTVLLEGFSQRAQQVETDRSERIVAFRAAHGREPNAKELLEIGKRAQYATRLRKQPPKTLAEHVAGWRAHAEQLIGAGAVRGLSQRIFTAQREPLTQVDVAGLARVTLAVVADYHSHFTRWNIEAEAHRQTAHLRLPPGGRDALIRAVTDAVTSDEGTLALRGPALVAEAAVLRRRSGESVFIEHNSQRYTTEHTLRCEQALVAWARRRGGHRVDAAALDRAVAGNRLNTGQRRMVESFARSGRRVQLALAPAGAGKTTAMRVFAQAWRDGGGRVFAFAPSARAAQELGASIKARPHTLHELTTALRYGKAQFLFALKPGDVVIIDEAAMSGTHTLHTVVTYAMKRGADVRLVGDDRQLGAVEAGGAIRLIAHDVGALRFREVVRFTDKDQAEASLKIRVGDRAGLQYYFDHGRVQGGSRETMRDAAQKAWRADLDAGKQTLLIVPTNDDVGALNLQARAQRIRRGDINGGRAVNLHDGTTASIGDWVVTRKNNRTLSLFAGKDFVKNGDTWHITAVHPNGDLAVTHRAHGGATVLPAYYVAAHLELAYAATANRVQGMTAEHSAHTLVPETMSREQFYPAITRARDANHAYVITHHHVADDHLETPPAQTANEVLVGVLSHSGLETSATEELRAAMHREESLATLVLRHDYAARLGDTDRYLDLIARHAPDALGQPAEPALVQTLRNAHDLGWHPDRILTKTALSHGIGEAHDPAALLTWRINHHVSGRTPPPAVGEPRLADINRWRTIIEEIAPTAAVEDCEWNLVWQHAAGGQSNGLDADAAIAAAAHQLVARLPRDRVDDHRYLARAVATELAGQRDDGRGYRPAVPWLARPDFVAAAAHAGMSDYLTEMNAAIAGRASELRQQVAREQPQWTAGLGPRPQNAEAAHRWDTIAGLAAAYRETYDINTDSTSPIGEKPDSNGPKTRAWQHITNQWRPIVTAPNPNDHRASNQRAINALRDHILELRDDIHDQATKRRADYLDDDHATHHAEDQNYDEDYDTDEGHSIHSGLSH